MAGGRKSGGAKNSIITLITLLILGGAILSWARINSIHSAADAYNYFKAWSDKVQDCGANDVEWHCDRKLDLPEGSGGNGQITLPGGGSGGVKIPSGKDVDKNVNINPPSAKDAVNSSAPTVNSAQGTLQQAIGKIPTFNEDKAKKVAYKRSDWRHWIGDPCDTRDNVLAQQGKNVKLVKTSTTCNTKSGEWLSPYDGKKFTDSKLMDIDHVIPLSYAAQHGGQEWPASKKQQFANDTTQLYAVSANSNRSKGDKGPSEYMPQDTFKCQYAKAWVSTATKYGVSLPKKDKDVLTSTLKTCKG